MSEIKLKPLPIGHSFFDRVIEDELYYIDKTLFIKDLLDRKTAVSLCTRPRRFGKTLNQTMLKCFFEDTRPLQSNGAICKDTRSLFKGLNIERTAGNYMEHQGNYPVIFLSLKDVKYNNFDSSYDQFRYIIIEEFHRHCYVLEKINNKEDAAMFDRLTSGSGSIGEYSNSLRFLCKCLENYHGKKTVVLIDEYDVPLENSWSRGFYQEMIDFIRPLFASAFKDNPHLQLSVITGCLRISRESIFTGLNNLEIISILNNNYSEYFGFTQNEMDNMLKYYNLESKLQIVRDWYNGYLFGNAEVYNPWSSVLIVSDWIKYIDKFPMPYWVNTSSNDIVRKLIDKADDDTKTDLGILMSGRTISKAIHEDITYDEIDKSPNNLWNLLFFTGYLKRTGKETQCEDGIITHELTIPNTELRYIYNCKISE